MAGEAARMQRREHAAAQTISCALIVHRRALVRWPGKWSHIKVSGHIGLIPHGSVAYGTCFTETEECATIPQLYDTLGVGYGSYRRPDPRIAAAIMGGLGEFAPIVNVGAGTGSYEPSDRLVVAVEPSRAMIRQRQARMIPVVQASAVHLPFRHAAFAAALAVLTIHHWSDRERGLAELARVARHRLVIVTYDPAATGFWLVEDYFPAIGEIDRQILPLLEEFRRAVWPVDIRLLPIPHDCTDGFLGAYWRRPYAYLDPGVRRAISTFAKVPHIDAGLTRLRADPADGTWARRYGYLLHQTALDIGYRLVIAHLGSRGTTEGYESQANRFIRERDTVIQEGTIRGAAQGLRAEKAGLPSHISNDKYDEGCRPSATGPYPRDVSSCGRNPDDDGG